jgi:hypothetical protein
LFGNASGNTNSLSQGNATNLLVCAAAWMRQKDSPLSDPAVWISDPVSRDNDRWIALNWMLHGEGSSNEIWRVNPDGSDAVSLTSKEFGDLGDARRTGSSCTIQS